MRVLVVWGGALLLAGAQAIGQNTITGKVTDRETGRPLGGANVSLIASGIGDVTQSDGEYRLKNVPGGYRQLRFSYVGYQAIVLDVLLTRDTVMNVLLAPSPVLVQPITVTATRGRERETPITFSTLTAADLREHYTTQDIPVLLSELPSSTFYSEGGGGIGYTYLSIRGFDSRRIAVMVNGVPQNDPEDHNVYWLDMPDLAANTEDIQVQRGAGSAFYGPPAIGGSVNLVTTDLGRERAFSLSAGAGSFNTRKYSVAYSSGLLGNRYAFAGRLSRITSDGYRDRAWIKFTSYFLSLARYDENMTTQVNFYGGPIADGLAYYGIPKADITDRVRRKENPIARPQEMENFVQPHYELLHEWRMSPGLTLNTTAFYVMGDGFFDYDGSWAPYSYFRLTPAYGIKVTGDPDTLTIPGALIRAQVTNHQWGVLPRLTIHHEKGMLIVGGELRRHRSVHWGRLQYADQLPLDVPLGRTYYEFHGEKEMASVYAHELYDLDPQLKLMLDVQYAYNRYRLSQEEFLGTYFSVPYHFINPRVGLNYNLDDFWSTYISAAYTSREPRLNNLYDAAEASTPSSWGAVVPQFAVRADGTMDFSQPLVKPESLLDFEIGARYATSGVSASANGFWMEFSHEIVKSGQVDRFGQPITGNAGRTRHIGVEVAAKAAVWDGLELNATATLGRNYFVRHDDYSAGSPHSLDGNPIAGFPDALANVRVTYRHDAFALSWLTRFVGKQYTDNFRNEEHTVDPYTVSDASFSYTWENIAGGASIAATLQASNIFDALYAAYGEGDSFFVGAERGLFLHLALRL